MTNFKLFLKHAAQELGLDVIHSLKIVVTELFSTLRRWARKESSATQDLMDAAWVLKELVAGSLDDMRITFFKVVQSPEDFWTFVKTFKKEASVVCGVAAHQPMPMAVAGLYWEDLLDSAWAAGCFDWTQKLQALARVYDPAVIKHLDDIKANPEFAKKILNENALEGLAETIHVKIKKENGSADIKNKSEWAQKRIHRMMESFDADELSAAMEGLTQLKARKADLNEENYENFVSSLSYKNNMPFQSVLALAHLKNKNLLDKVVGFEEPADFSALKMGDFTLPSTKSPKDESGRKWDVLLEDDKMLEVKGAKAVDTQKLDSRFEREFKNDVLHHLFRIDTPPAEFEWIIKTEGGKEKYKAAMKKLLGEENDKTVEGDIDDGLLRALAYMEYYDEKRYKLALERLEKLREKLNADQLVFVGSVNR